MARLDLTSEETQVLTDVLDNYLSELRMEIADTDLQDFRNILKVRKEVLNRILESLRREASPA